MPHRPDAAFSGRLHRGARGAVNVCGWMVLALVAWLAWPANLGGLTSYVLVSGESMLPTFEPKDMVIARDVLPQVGDVIVYAPTDLGGSQIVHRITGGNADSGWVMQGDNNDFIDPFEPSGDEVKGVVVAHLPFVGHLTAWVLNPLMWIFVLIIAAAVVVWPSRDAPGDDGPSDDGGDAATGRGDGVNAAGAGRSARRYGAAMSTFAAAAVLGVLAGVSPASASQLSVLPSSEASSTPVYRCGVQGTSATTLASTSTGSVTSGNYGAVKVSGLPSACRGKPAAIALYDGSGGLLWSASGSTSTSGTSFDLSHASATYRPASVKVAIVTIGGWLFVSSWDPGSTGPSSWFTSCSATLSTGATVPCGVNPTDVTVGPRTAWSYGAQASGEYQRVAFTVSPTAAMPSGARAVNWTATIDVSQLPGLVIAPVRTQLTWQSVTLISPPGCANYPVMTVRSEDSQFSQTWFVGTPSATESVYLCGAR
ncbi:S24/S26 family peptidase [Demequina sp. NBRC 110057]|uniref:S24/S26 family peptidase n=1 Tax=Demequina sp. NBRC 110057 TaxID=1570346 RepID=UPI000A05AC37|nr:S24/S26 family peptidase [Demequina sp. NBRC 110057]